MGPHHELDGQPISRRSILGQTSSNLAMNTVDQEEFDPPQDTTMMIWDLDLIMPSNDLFESREQLAEVSVTHTRSKGPPGSKDTDAT
jgi:hypothetical protein